MNKKIKLTKSISEEQFDNGYWYANEIKLFAKNLELLILLNCAKTNLKR